MVNIEKKVSKTIYNAKLNLPDGDKIILEQACEILADITETLSILEDDEDIDGFDLDFAVEDLVDELFSRADDIKTRI